MMWWGNDGWGASGTTTAMMVVMMLVGIAAAVVLTLWVVRRLGSGTDRPDVAGRPDRRPSTSYDAAESELARRFAAGEIDEAQFDRTRAVLHRDRP